LRRNTEAQDPPSVRSPWSWGTRDARRLAALRAGQYVLVKATIVGAIVANSLVMLGASFLIGGLKHHVQTYNRNNARLQAGMLFLATIALLIPSILAETDPSPAGYH
jgi:Ca2+:H+ antiporter